MSHDIYFQCGARKVGHVHFSSFTDERQKRAYGGLSFSSCITYGDGGDDGFEGEATTIEHRHEYDVPKLRELVRLLEECSRPDIRAYCRIRLSY